MGKSRVISLDLFRGILIIAMIIFHVLTNLTKLDSSFNHQLFYWVPAGFSMFLGVIIAKFLDKKPKKLLKIALKLIAIFLVLNVINLKNNNIAFIDFLLGNQEKFSFEILFPMGVFTFLSIVLHKLSNKKLTAIILSLIIAISLFLNIKSIYSYNLSMFLFAASGYFLEKLIDLNEIAEKLKNKKAKDPVFLVFLVFFIAQLFYIQNYIFLELIIFLEIIFLFLISFILFENKTLTLLGKYSLLIYILHIFIIKAITLTIN